MVPGPTTQSQGRAPPLDGASSSASHPQVGSDPDNVVSEQAPQRGFSPPLITGSNETTQLMISMEMLAAQVRWAADEIRGFQRERFVEGEGRRSTYLESPATTSLMARDLGQALVAPMNTPFHRPPFISQTPLTHPTGFLFPAPVGSPLFPTTHHTQPPIFPAAPYSQPTVPPLNHLFSSLKPRPEFPLFTGKEVYNWIFRVEQLLDYYEVPPDQRMRNAALYLEEEPLQWFRWWVKAKGYTHWGEFMTALAH